MSSFVWYLNTFIIFNLIYWGIPTNFFSAFVEATISLIGFLKPFIFLGLIYWGISFLKVFLPSQVYYQLDGVEKMYLERGDKFLASGWRNRPLEGLDNSEKTGDLLLLNLRG